MRVGGTWSSGSGGVWVPGAVSGVLAPLGSILHVVDSSIPRRCLLLA